MPTLESRSHYDPNQPRVPSGEPDGGQWTDAGGPEERPGANRIHIPDDFEARWPERDDALVQPAGLKLPNAYLVGPVVIRRGIAPLLAQYSALTDLYNSAIQRAVLAINAREFDNGTIGLSAGGVQVETTEEFNKTCKELDRVQKLTNKAAKDAGFPWQYRSAANYGTAVHYRLAQAIKDLNDPDFDAERSYVKQQEDAYGDKTAIRVDVIEILKDHSGTVCIYDIKTGRAGLSARRMAEIAIYVFRVTRGAVTRILITEVRPTKDIEGKPL